MKAGKKGIVAMLCAALLTGLCGCAKTETEDGNLTEPQKGRYVQVQETLLGELEDWTVKQLFAEKDELHLLAAKQEGKKTILREWARQGEEYTDVTQDWLASLELPCEDWLTVQLLQEESGTQYLFAGYVAEGSEDYTGHLWRSDGKMAKEITPEKWTVVNEDWGGYEYIMGAEVLEDHTLAAYSYNSLDILLGEDGSLQRSEALTAYYGDGLAAEGENIYLELMSDNGNISAFEKRRNGKESEAEIISLPENTTISKFCALKDGVLIAAGRDGIFKYQPQEAQWKKLMEGIDTDFGLSGCWCVCFTAMEDGRIYALFQNSDGEVTLNLYEYDPEAIIEVTNTLKLYTVHESYLLSQAAALYHREHPEVMISIEYVYPRYYYEVPDYNSVYQGLNTMLMGDSAPDILVMDHLNMDSYISKGLLADLSDVMEPLESSGALVDNITGAYVQENGSRYVVPLQFGFNIVTGRDIAVENMESLQALAEFLSKTEYSYLGDQTVSELVDKFYPYFCGEIISGKQLNSEALGEVLENLKAIADNCGIVSTREKDESCFNMWDLSGEAKLAFEEADGFKGCLFPMAMMNYIQGDFTAFENCFIPSVQMGISAKSQYLDVAKDFLRFALSEAVQDTDYYSGFPVNLSSLEKQCHSDRSDAEAETAIMVDGGYETFQIKDYSREIADQLLALCRRLERPVKEDSKIREVLIESLDGYLKGTQSKDETIQMIEGGLKMYLAE